MKCFHIPGISQINSDITCQLKVTPSACWSLFSEPQVWWVQGEAQIILVEPSQHSLEAVLLSISSTEARTLHFLFFSQCLDPSTLLVHTY